jgi:hypothetical protein
MEERLCGKGGGRGRKRLGDAEWVGEGRGIWDGRRTASPRCVFRSHVFRTVYSVVTSAASAERGRRKAAAAREVGRRIVAGSGGGSDLRRIEMEGEGEGEVNSVRFNDVVFGIVGGL